VVVCDLCIFDVVRRVVEVVFGWVMFVLAWLDWFVLGCGVQLSRFVDD